MVRCLLLSQLIAQGVFAQDPFTETTLPAGPLGDTTTPSTPTTSWTAPDDPCSCRKWTAAVEGGVLDGIAKPYMFTPTKDTSLYSTVKDHFCIRESTECFDSTWSYAMVSQATWCYVSPECTELNGGSIVSSKGSYKYCGGDDKVAGMLTPSEVLDICQSSGHQNNLPYCLVWFLIHSNTTISDITSITGVEHTGIGYVPEVGVDSIGEEAINPFTGIDPNGLAPRSDGSAAASPGNEKDRVSRIAQLKKLYDDGTLDDEEFKAAKAKVFSKPSNFATQDKIWALALDHASPTKKQELAKRSRRAMSAANWTSTVSAAFDPSDTQENDDGCGIPKALYLVGFGEIWFVYDATALCEQGNSAKCQANQMVR